MNPVRKLLQDLVDKKLWPAALLLIVTAIAIPLVIGGGGNADTAGVPDPAAALPQSSAAVTPAVELVGPPAVRTRSGAVRDPFRRAKAKAAAGASQGVAASSASSAGTSAAATSAASKSSVSTSATGTTAKAKPAVKPAITVLNRSSFQTVVRFARPGGTRERPLARLAVLGNSAAPALQYLGVAGDAKHAIFVLGPNATATGASACVVAEPCRAIALREGQKLGVDVVGADLAVRHYEVEVLMLRELHMGSASRARAQRARVDPAGNAVLKTLEQDPETASVLARLRYATLTGTVRLITAP